jgi:DNA-binding HxlR family transcriptional regulator
MARSKQCEPVARIMDALRRMKPDKIMARVQQEKRTERIDLRLTPSEKALLDGLASRCDTTVTRLVVGLAAAAAVPLVTKPRGR